MAYEAKVTLLNSIKDLCADTLTSTQSDQLLGMIADTLSRYEVELIADNTPETDDCLNAFLSAKAVEGRSENTLARYKYIISRLMDSVNVTTREITVYHLRKYLSGEKLRGMSDRSLEGMREVFSSYFNWLQREGMLKQNPTANLGTIKCRKVVREAYKETDVERLRYACDNPRDRAIVSFMRSTGCRVSEIVNLDLDLIDINKRECKVLGKGNKERVVYFDAVTAMFLHDYLETRTDNCAALFPNLSGQGRMSAQGMRAMLHRLQDKCGITASVHPHKFRRTLATTLIHKGMPIQEVAAVLGHDKLDTTMKYVVIDQQDVKHSYDRYSA